MKDFICYLEALPAEAWRVSVNTSWTVKDVVAHLVGWERECARALPETLASQQPPWFTKTDEYEDFNARNIEEYKKYTPEELLAEWKKWQRALDKEIERIGEHTLRMEPDLFEWLFDESHYAEHYDQIQKAVQ